MSDNIKLKELLVSQIEYSDNFRLNTEKTLNRIKDEFRTIVQELETLKKKSNNKDDNNSSNNNINSTNLLISGIGFGNSGNENRINSGNNSNNNPNNQNSNINPINENNNSSSLPLKVNLIK